MRYCRSVVSSHHQSDHQSNSGLTASDDVPYFGHPSIRSSLADWQSHHTTMFSRWNCLSLFSGALDRGRLLACCGVCGAVLANRRLRRAPDELPPYDPNFTPKSAFRVSVSLKAPDLPNSSGARRSSRFVCLPEGPALNGGVTVSGPTQHGNQSGVRSILRLSTGREAGRAPWANGIRVLWMLQIGCGTRWHVSRPATLRAVPRCIAHGRALDASPVVRPR